MTHYAIITSGTRGDVQPYVALALGLMASGHRVSICTEKRHEAFVQGYGVEFRVLPGDTTGSYEVEKIRDARKSGNMLLVWWHMAKQLFGILREVCLALENVVQDADVILGGTMGVFCSWPVALRLRKPVYMVSLQWLVPTSAFRAFDFPAAPTWLGKAGWYNRASYLVTNGLFAFGLSRLLAPVSEAFGVPRIRFRTFWRFMVAPKVPVVYGFSKSVLPVAREWSEEVHCTGFWVLQNDKEWVGKEQIAEFLRAGDQPVLIGFGSMSSVISAAQRANTVQAIKDLKIRALLFSEDVKEPRLLTDEILEVGSTSHEWLLPQMALIVHHGGMGTMSAAGRAGIRQLVIPALGDQMFWADQVSCLGVGSRLGLSPSVVEIRNEIVMLLENHDMAAAAEALARKLRLEDGVSNAVRLIETLPTSYTGIGNFEMLERVR